MGDSFGGFCMGTYAKLTPLRNFYCPSVAMASTPYIHKALKCHHEIFHMQKKNKNKGKQKRYLKQRQELGNGNANNATNRGPNGAPQSNYSCLLFLPAFSG